MRYFWLTLLLLHITQVQADTASTNPEQMLQQINQEINNIDTKALQAILKKDPNTVLIDVRTQDELNITGGLIDAPISRNIPRGWLEFRVGEIANKDSPIVVYCGTNRRSPFAAKRLMELGYSNVKNYADGFNQWKQQKLPVYASDNEPDTFLFNLPVKVSDNVYSAIGATAPGTYANSGHNNNLSFIIAEQAVVVVNAGENYLLAQALHTEIKKITDKPVKFVVLENAQGHAAMGAQYWHEQGAKIVAHKDATAILKKKGKDILARVKQRRRDKATGTQLVIPDISFDKKMRLDVKGEPIELLYLGDAHSPGDIQVWLPKQKLIIAGDLAFHQRLLPIFEYTNTAEWINTWQAFESLKAEVVIPGHGEPTDMQQVTLYTRDYLQFLRNEVGQVLDDDGTLTDAYNIDQSAYAHLHTYDRLAKRNVAHVYKEMEFE